MIKKTGKNFIKIKIFKNYLNRIKIFLERNIALSIKFFNYKVVPYINKKVELINDEITNEDGIEFWSSLTSSKKWSSRIIWILVGVSGFGIIYATFALVDETVQTTGKLEPRGKTIDVKVPLGGVIKKIIVEEGQLVEKDQILLELDTTAVKANLKALKKVRSQINADIALSKIQLGGKEDIESLTSNQKIKF